MDLSYALAPVAAWLATGSMKFLINSIMERRLAFDLIGYGGLPSNHTAIVSCMAALVALKEGFAHPAFGIAATLAFIVVLDAGSLRRHVGRHAEAINRLAADNLSHKRLRERIGHSKVEIAAGVLVGFLVALALQKL